MQEQHTQPIFSDFEKRIAIVAAVAVSAIAFASMRDTEVQTPAQEIYRTPDGQLLI